MNQIIFDIFGLDSNTELSKFYLSRNPSLFANGYFIKKIFIKSILKSNIDLAEYLYLKCSWSIDSMEHKEIIELFKNIITEGKLNCIEWYYRHFDCIDLTLNNWSLFRLACGNRNKSVLEWIINKNKNKNIPIEVIEDMFSIGLSTANLQIIKYIYNLYPRIDLTKMNSVIIKSPIFAPTISINLVIEWLKIICTENNYIIRILLNNQLEIIDSFYVRENPNLHNNLPNSDEKICQLCLDNTCNIFSNCSHQYCKYCIRQWMIKNYSCPYCRKSENIEFYYL